MITPELLDSKVQFILDKQIPFKFNVDIAEEFLDELNYESAKLGFKLYEMLGDEVTIRNFIDLASAKYPEFKPTVFTAKGNPSMTDDALVLMPFEEAKLMRDYNVHNKIISFLKSWLSFEVDGYISHKCKAVGTSTSRVSHSNPNLGQIPSAKGRRLKKDFGRRCREMFSPGDGLVQLGVDVSGLELRMLAHYLYMFDGGRYANEIDKGDIHVLNQKSANLSTRDSAKDFIFSWLYGAGLDLLSKKLGLTSTDEAKVISDNFLLNTKGLNELRDAVYSRVDNFRYIKTLTGRKIYCDSKHKSLNYLLQSAGAEVTKIWMCMLHKDMESHGYVYGVDWYQMAYVFDELQLAVKENIKEEVGAIALKSLLNAGRYCKLNIDLLGEFKTGTNWSETH